MDHIAQFRVLNPHQVKFTFVGTGRHYRLENISNISTDIHQGQNWQTNASSTS